MKVLISTPMYGNMCSGSYMRSLISSREQALKEGIATEIEIHCQSDSLIHRARNRAAMYFLRHDYDKLVTIDADIVWSYEDFKRLITSPHHVTGGAYPLKAFPIVMNFNPLVGRGTELLKTERGFDLDAWELFVKIHADENGYAPVRHLATGFLSVTREALEAIAPYTDKYAQWDSVSGVMEYQYNLYPSQVHGSSLESEDWAHCRMLYERGFCPQLDTRIRLGHIGNFEFRLGQVMATIPGV